MKFSIAKCDDRQLPVRQWIEERAGRPVKIEIAPHCGEDGIVIRGLELLNIEEGPLLAFADVDRRAEATISVSDQSLAAPAAGNSTVLHLDFAGLCLHIWDSDRVVEAHLKAGGFQPIESGADS